MSLQLPRRFHLAKLSAVVSLLLTGNTLYAANIGATHINSNQNEPLSATIDISDIDPDTFSVSLADSNIYQQLGLNATSTMSAQFVKTGSNTGQVVITTSAPIAEPFTDVVLTVNDNGNQKVVPKTLLLPIDESSALPLDKVQPANNTQATSQPKSQTTGNTAKPNLPVINMPSVENSGIPLVVNKSEPPPLQSGAKPTDTSLQAQSIEQQDTNDSVVATSTKNNDDKEQVNVASAQQSEAQADSASTSTTPDIALGKATYTVQRNDNLWTIAHQIAKANSMDVHTVMQQIQTYNQDAFINNNASLLKANVTLTLPDYEVIPSKLGIRAAIEARQAQQQTASANNRRSSRSSNSNRTNRANHTARSNNTPSRTTRTAQALPTKPQVTLVTPGSSGSATGSQTQSSANGTGLNNELFSQLQSSRQQTANRVRQVRSLSGQLSERTKQIQLQNNRLAELEQRLKDLRNN